MIDSSQVTFVMQGVVDRSLTSQALASIRQHFSDSHIILSTWEGSDVEGLDIDQLILSPDPGGFKAGEVKGKSENVNRLITSASVGLREVKTNYAVKTRTDIVMQHSKLLEHLSEFCVDSNRIVQTNLIVGNPFAELFHPSDTFLAGKTTILQQFFDVPLASKSIMKTLAPEQYLGMLHQNYCNKKSLESYLTSYRYDLDHDLNIQDHTSMLNDSLSYLSEQFTTLLSSQVGAKLPSRINANEAILPYIDLLLEIRKSEPEKLPPHIKLYTEWFTIDAKLYNYKGLKKSILKLKRSIFKKKYMANSLIKLTS